MTRPPRARPAVPAPPPGPCSSQPCPYQPDAPRPAPSAAERSLPRVPLPAREDSCAQFLDWRGPPLTGAERAETEAGVRELLAPDGPGHRLQRELAAYDTDSRSTSWLDDFWEQRYLGRTDRIALNANYSLLLHGAPQGQAERAATLITAFVRHRSRLDAGTLPAATSRGQALSTRQTRSLYSTTRIPGTPRDPVRTAGAPGTAPARHVVVLHQGAFFRLDVLGPDGPHTPAPWPPHCARSSRPDPPAPAPRTPPGSSPPWTAPGGPAPGRNSSPATR